MSAAFVRDESLPLREKWLIKVMRENKKNEMVSSSDPMRVEEWFRRRVEEAPNKPFITFMGDSWTRGEAYNNVQRLAFLLKQSGVRAGDRVGYFGFDHPMFLAAMFATAEIRAVFVPLNFRLSEVELTEVVGDAGIGTLLFDAGHQTLVERRRKELGCRSYFSISGLTEAMRELPTAVDIRKEYARRVAGASDIALLMYTSGTTGRAKGVMITHRNIWMSNITGILGNSFNSNDVGLSCAPLFHAAALNSLSLPLLMAGGHLVLLETFDEAMFLAAVEQYRVSVSLLVPTMMTRISQYSAFPMTNMASMRLLMTGGAPVSKYILEIYNNHGVLTNQGYGMTETTSGVVLLSGERAIEKVGSCGKATMLTEIKIIDQDGAEILEPHVPGEVCIRGPTVSPGYWGLPDETAAVFDSEHWLHSGDISYFDDDGFYYICDRKKDMIISGGENVYAAEVENVFCEHPAVAEIAIIGTNDDEWGERVTAIVVLNPGCTLDLSELSLFGQGRVARYKVPSLMYLVDSLPRTSTGKINKAALRQCYNNR